MTEPLRTLRLETYRDKHRLLLVFAPSPQDEQCLEQRRFFNGLDKALSERDLLVLYLFDIAQGQLGDLSLSSEVAHHLRKRFGLPPATFTVVLIGKDGTEKERYKAPVDPASLFATIDQMPMRRREMKRRDAE